MRRLIVVVHAEDYEEEVACLGFVSEVSSVVLVFGNETRQKSIIFTNNEKTGTTSTALMDGDVSINGAALTCVISGPVCAIGAPLCAGVCIASAIADDSGLSCYLCAVTVGGVCANAACACAQACCDGGHQICCDHLCPG